MFETSEEKYSGLYFPRIIVVHRLEQVEKKSLVTFKSSSSFLVPPKTSQVFRRELYVSRRYLLFYEVHIVTNC